MQRLAASALPDFLLVHAVEDVADRLGLIKRQFARALSIGSYHGVMADRLRARGIAQVVEAEPVGGLLGLGNRSNADDLIVAD